MTDPIIWPSFLAPAQILANPVPFSRSGGVSLGGIERVTRTDRGWWQIDYKGVPLYDAARRRVWNALRTTLSGMAESIAVPVWSFDTSPWAAGTVDGKILTPHDDGTSFSDGSLYSQSSIVVRMGDPAAIGDTSIVLRLVDGIEDLVGVRFSNEHALYETGVATSIDGEFWTVRVFPAIRAPIAAGTYLEFDMPTCRVRLASDNAMDVSLTAGSFDRADVSFTEDVSYWSDAAA